MMEPRDDSEPALDEELVAELRRFAGLETVLVALDFDGTLAPLVDVPADARALPAAVDQLVALQRLPGVTIAFVSGRSLASLEAVVPPDVTAALVGSHGLEVHFAGADALPAVDDADRERVRRLREQLEPVVAATDRAWLELKPAGLAVHTRLVDPAAAFALADAVRSIARELDSALTVRDGKSVVEFSVRDATKGDGLQVLRERVAPDAVMFAGDDVTDEDAFAVLEPHDLGIKVGAAATSARFRVGHPAELVQVLQRLVDLRRSLGHGR